MRTVIGRTVLELAEGDIAVKRPGGGISPMDDWDLVGVRLEHGKSADELI